MDVNAVDLSLTCMATATAVEASNENEAININLVIMNRLRSGKFGDDICEVVWSHDDKGNYQFTGLKDVYIKHKRPIPSKEVILKNKLIAWKVYYNHVPNKVGNALFYHDTSIETPYKWKTKKMVAFLDHLKFFN